MIHVVFYWSITSITPPANKMFTIRVLVIGKLYMQKNVQFYLLLFSLENIINVEFTFRIEDFNHLFFCTNLVENKGPCIAE